MKSIKTKMLFAFALCAISLFAAGPKYVFLLIGDGMTTPQRMITERYSMIMGGEALAMNNLKHICYTRTCSASSAVTDSAAAATAIACGVKAINGQLGLAPDGTRHDSIAVYAKSRGMKVGIMTTVPVVHATPAGFYAHRKSRNDSYGIALDLLASGFDLFAASGVYDKFDDKKHAEYRGNVFELAKAQGYVLAKNKAEFAALKPGMKTWSIFGTDGMPYSIEGYGEYPNMTEMLEKAIEMLEGPQGFFIMFEGGKIDYACHGNDAGTMIQETLELDRAVKVAKKFMEKHPEETLIVTTGDHETGGLTLGKDGKYRYNVELYKYQTNETGKFSQKITGMIEKNPEIGFDEVRPLIEETYGLIFDSAKADNDDKKKLVVTDGEVKKMKKAFENDVEMTKSHAKETRKHDVARKRKFAKTCMEILADHANVGWTSGAHTGLPTMTTAEGCGAEKFRGTMENTDIPRILRELIGNNAK